MGWIEYYKPFVVVVMLKFILAAVSVSSKASFSQGMSPRIFVFYRQVFATLFIVPVAYFSRSTGTRCFMGWKTFSLIFITAFFGVTGAQMLLYEGIYLASSSAASALFNIIPAITFITAAILGYEPTNIRSLRTIVKILGTILSITGAATMALIKGPKLLNAYFSSPSSLVINPTETDNNLWLWGCLCVFASACCWSFWLIIQVSITRNYPDHLSLSAWLCFLSMIQSGTITLFTDPYVEAWKIKSYLQLGSCLYAGIVGSGISIFGQSWLIEKRGPVFSATFNPLTTVIVTIFSSTFLHEEIYTGSLIGAFGIITGLYGVLWGKAKDLEEKKEEQKKTTILSQNEENSIVRVSINGSNLIEPLLPNKF